MKRKRNYLLAAFLLAVGMLTGCAEKSVGLQDASDAWVEEAEIEEADTEGAGVQEEEPGEEGIPSAKIEGAAVQEEEPPKEDIPSAEAEEVEVREEKPGEADAQLSEDGTYTSKEEVAEYIYLYEHLPDNFITKKEAKALGWVSSEGNLGQVAPGKSIGGDYFGNFEGNLPEKKGREYHECDIDSDGGYRGAKRIVYSNDGLIYYTEDHYETFELLYGEE